MSLFGAMRTSITGMSAQSDRLGSVADNISNASTTGYKRAAVEFETVLGSNATRSYAGGGVTSHVRNDIKTQGTLQQTARVTDLAIQGSGFFAVSNTSGATYLTRAGAFVPDASGNLVNTAGYKLMGYKLSESGASPPSNGLNGLEVVNINQNALVSSPTTKGRFTANLPSEAAIVPAANLPSTNAAGALYTAKSSLVAYDDLGRKVTLDVYFAKTANNAWQMSVYDQAGATAGGFPYASGPLTTANLTFDPTTGRSTGSGNLSVTIPNGRTVALDIGGTTQFATDYAVTGAQMNGNAPSRFDHVEIDTTGTVSAVYEDGTRIDTYKVPLANVTSPDNLTPIDGNVYAENPQSGPITVGSARESGLGKIISSALENSTVDLASELTSMIEAQRGYSANTKVFQTGSEMLEELLNLRR